MQSSSASIARARVSADMVEILGLSGLL
jgi:hypothetical protein